MASRTIPSADRKMMQLMHEYYNLLHTPQIKKLSKAYYDYQTSQQDVTQLAIKNSKEIARLESLFNQLVSERNKYSERKGYNNFIDYTIARDKLPKSKVHEILKNAEKILGRARIHLLVPDETHNTEKTLDPFYFMQHRRFNLPNDIYSYLKKFDPEFYKNLGKIKLIQSTSYTTAIQDNNDSILIKANMQRSHVMALSNFVHELGHAKHIIATEKSAYLKLSRYKKESYAYKYQLKILKNFLQPYELDFVKWKILQNIADAYFEYIIHSENNPKIQETYTRSREMLFDRVIKIHSVDYLLNFKYQKYACESIMRGLIAYEQILQS